MRGIKEEICENVTEGRAANTPDASSALADVMPDGANALAKLAIASSSGGGSKRPRGRPRKIDVAGGSGSKASKGATKPKRPKAPKMAVAAAVTRCNHESCAIPPGKGGSKWVTVGF